MHIYIFGSICRGEYQNNSDIDLLVCVSEKEKKHEFDSSKFSIYHYSRLKDLWAEGNPFAWHLFLESKLVYSSDNSNFFAELMEPAPYSDFEADFNKFKKLYNDSSKELLRDKNIVFNLSCIFLSIRNIATCYSLFNKKPIFSRNSPYLIDLPLNLDANCYKILENSRVLSTRGIGIPATHAEIIMMKKNLHVIQKWLDDIERNYYES